MAVSEQVPALSSTGNGVTTVFPYTFKILREEDLEVSVDGVVKTLNTDYIVSGVGNDAGGNVAFTTAPASGTTVIRRRNMAFVRTTDYQYQGELPNDVLNDDQDAPILMLQQVNEQVGRALKVPVGESAVGFLPAAADRAGMFMGFDASGNPVALSGSGVGDSSLRADLAASTGGGLVGFSAGLLEAVARSMLAKVQEGWISPQDFGAVGDGVTDDDAAFRAWASAVGHPLKRIPGGKTYKVNPASSYDFVPGDWVVGDGMSSFIDASGGTLPAGGVVFRMAGTFTSLGKIMTAGAAEGVVSFPVSSVSGLSVGDVLCIHENTSSSWSAWRAEYHAGEFVEIGRIVGTTIYPTQRLWDTYASTVDVYKLDNRGGYFGHFRIKTQAAQIVGWQFDAIRGARVDDVRVENTTYAGGEFKRCYDIEGRGAAFQSTPSTDDEYGITVSNSQRGNFYMSSTGGRHPISFGGGLYAGCVPTRNMRVFGGYFGNLGPTGAGDAHGNTQDIHWNGTLFANGCDIGGADNKWNQCVLLGNTNSGIAAYVGEPVKGTFEFNQCLIDTAVNPNTSNFGLVHVGNMTYAKAEWQIVLNQCEYRAPAATTIPIWVNISAGTYAPDIIVQGGINKCAGATQFIRLERSAGPATIDLVKVRELSGLPSGCYYATNVGAGLTVTRYEMPEQTGYTDIAIGTAASSYSGAVTFRNAYPVAPLVHPSGANGTYGGKRSIPYANSETTTGFTGAFATADGANFASADTARLKWTARLSDQ